MLSVCLGFSATMLVFGVVWLEEEDTVVVHLGPLMVVVGWGKPPETR